jgi:signal transduction histidine kinase/ligand-binding sensor domain-containing protein
MLALLASCLLGIPGGDSTPPRPITQLVHTRWTANDGAPTEILTLAQTTDGYLWLGTRWGLVRFDGVRFVQFAPRGGDTLPAGGVASLLAARDGSLWIVSLSGAVSRLRDGRVTSYGEQDGLPAAFQLAESGSGTLVAGTVGGLARFTEGKWKDAGREWQYPGGESKAVWFDPEGALWAETEDRVVYLPAGGSRFLDPGMPLAETAQRAAFAQARDGSIWMAEVNRSVHTVPRVGDRSPITELILGSLTLLIDRKGSLWFGTLGDGLGRIIDPTRIRGRKVDGFGVEAERFTQKDGLLSDVVHTLLEDREGNIWVGSDRGLERFREGAFAPVATPGSVRPRFVFASRDTAIWTAAFSRHGVLRLGPGGPETVPTEFFATNLVQDRAGVLWSVYGDKVFRLQGRRFVPVPLGRSDIGQFSDITADPDGTVWVFDEKLGLLRLTPDGLASVAPLHQTTFPRASLFSDRNGRIWVGQRNRVALYDHGRVSLFAAAQGLPTGRARSFLQDRAGNVWVGGDAGVSKIEGVRVRSLPDHQGGALRSVYGLAEDEAGAWWVVTRTGVHLLPPGELDRALADSSHVIRHRTFDALDGLPGMVTGGNPGPQVIRAPDGRIWVATDSGVAGVDPRNLPRGAAPAVLIEAVRVNGRELSPSEDLAIPPRSHDLEIDYTATSLSVPERIQFRYRLEGEDQAWHSVGTRRRAYYTRLGPGAYRFRVMASNADGEWSETEAGWSFRILPAWYQTLWFKAAAVLLIGGLGAAAAALIQRRRHLRAQETLKGRYEATLAERARIAQDLHDTLLQGFAGVTLQLKAAELALPEQPDVAAETILRVQRLARESLREARERVWDLREAELGRDDLAAALEGLARERTAGTGIEVSVTNGGERRPLARSVEDAAFRIGREAVANAVRHAEPRRIEIHLEFGATTLRLEVRDDGRGFTAEEAEEARRRGHFGLSGSQERARGVGGRCDVLARPGGGTIVALELPYI